MVEDTPERTVGQIIGGNMRRIREAGLYSQHDVSAKAGLSERAVTNLEAGSVRRPRRETVEKIAEALGVEFSDLLEDAEDSTPLAPSLREDRPEPQREPTASELGVEEGRPDPRVWGRDEDRPDPRAGDMPAPGGHRIAVRIEDGTGPTSKVEITRESFLELFRKVKAGEIEPEAAVAEVERSTAA